MELKSDWPIQSLSNCCNVMMNWLAIMWSDMVSDECYYICLDHTPRARNFASELVTL